MSAVFDVWAILNSVVIMLALGLAPRRQASAANLNVLFRAVLGYNFLLPALLLFCVQLSTGGFNASVLAALGLCIACAGGTSAGAFIRQVNGSEPLAAMLILSCVGSSIVSVSLLSWSGHYELGVLSLLELTGVLALITLLPFALGRWMGRARGARSARWQRRLNRSAGLSVILLVAALFYRYAVEILGGPLQPLAAAGLLVLILALPPGLLESDPVVRRTLVLGTLVRNLTLVLALLALMPNASALLPTVLAFGLAMYLACAALLWRWRSLTTSAV